MKKNKISCFHESADGASVAVIGNDGKLLFRITGKENVKTFVGAFKNAK